jgi:hypothetical protein
MRFLSALAASVSATECERKRTGMTLDRCFVLAALVPTVNFSASKLDLPDQQKVGIRVLISSRGPLTAKRLAQR